MFPPPWKDEARKSRRSGHVDCQLDFQHCAPSSSSPVLFSEQRDNRQQENRAIVYDGHDASPPGDRIRFEFSAAPDDDVSATAARGQERRKCRYTIHTTGRQPRGKSINNDSRNATNKRKRLLSKRTGIQKGPVKDDATSYPGGHEMSTASAESGWSSLGGRLGRSCEVQGALPGEGDSWRNKLLLQALRETGEEMKRRRQTHREVRARHTAEEREAASFAPSSTSSALIAASTPGLSRDGSTFSNLGRRTRAYLSKTGRTLPTTSKTSSSNKKSGNKRVGGNTARGGFAGSRAWKDSKAVAREADGGGTTATVSTTTSVQVTVVNGLPGREDSDSSDGVRRCGQGDDCGDGGRNEGAGNKTADTYREGSRRSSAARGSEGIMLPALKQGQRLVVNSAPTTDGGQGTAGHSGIDALHGSETPLRAKELSAIGKERNSGINIDGGGTGCFSGGDSSSGKSIHGRRQNAAHGRRQTLSAAPKEADDEAEAAEAGGAGTGTPTPGPNTATAVDGRTQQDPPPAPFRGTFWDEEDAENNPPAHCPRCAVVLVVGKEKLAVSTLLTILPADSLASFSRSHAQGAAGNLDSGSSGEPPLGLPDGGLGRRALVAHTKNEGNRRQFFQLYRRMARQVEIVGDTGALSQEGHTPRQEFIRKMLKMGRVPVPILLRDPSALQDLNLAHRGLGDDVMSAAAEVLTRLPHINTLNVADNRLTDRSLCKLCALVVGMPGLKSLDLSSNKVDEAAAIIRGYLAHPSCSLQTLSLRSADVDDNECCDLMEAISHNQSLTRLDISENKIGQNEMLNAVQPDVVTGGEGVAETLAGNVALKELNLSWNNLRQESAAAIGRALSLNRGLVSLNLAHNAFNNLPSQEVGDSLRTNGTLQSLDLSYNGLTPAAAIVIASACKANTSLTSLTLSGNRLGRQGSAALLSAIRRRTSASQSRKVDPLILGLEGCDCESDSLNLFDVEEPSGEYKLDMSLPYSRMLASELLSLSESKKGYEIESIWFAKDMESLDRPERRELVKTEREASPCVSRLKLAKPFAKAIAEIGQKASIASLDLSKRSGSVVPQSMAGMGGGGSNGGGVVLNGYERSRAKEQVMGLLDAVNLQPSRTAMESALDEMDWAEIKADSDAFFAVFRAAFRVFDKDRSGSLEVCELLELFKGLGCKMDEERCRTLTLVYDLDRSGFLEIEEFVTWMMLEHVKDPARQKGRLMEPPKAKPWPVPREGAYAIFFRASRYPGDVINVESAEGLAAMVDNIRHMNTATERLRMFENAAMHTDLLLTAKQAEMMASLVERDQFLESFLNAKQRLRLALRMKGLYRAIMGNPSGFYTLDLSSAQGRMAAIKLGEIANAERSISITRGACDTSQKGNRMMFRNEVMDTVPQNLSVDWFVKLPRRGTIRMDVISMARPRLSVKPLSDARFESLKALLGVNEEMQEIRETYEILEYERTHNKLGLRIWQRATAREASNLPKTASVGGTAVSSGGASDAAKLVMNDDGSVSNTNADPTSKTVPPKIGPASSGGSVRDVKQNRGHTGPMNSAELPYHYDAYSIFKAKDPHLKETVPTVEIPDCIISSHAIEQWQQFHASSHFFLDYVEIAKQSLNAPGGGVGDAGGGSSANVSATTGEGRGGAETGGRAPPLGISSSSAAFGATAGGGLGGGAGGAHGGGDRSNAAGAGTAAAGASTVPTRIYRWVFHRLLMLQTVASAAWYTCQQAMEIASAFPWQDFGRVQALIIVFSRIVDVDRFSEVVLSCVRNEERRELQHRLGILNVLNPVRPDGPYLLDLKCWEEREWAKILIKLAVEEPGANWDHETYTHARGTPIIQGWLLPESWTREDEDMGGDGGPRRSGILCLRYITDASLGCIAKWEVRRALRSRTLGGVKRVL
ncbi:Hypothetical leucine rich repeat calcium binding protein [Ectocarpus siliculosus]|uniref:Hypothetical leucine rich repeat calcium binding protein n=1 Tax=Ectocarpus siliculosus TaxID=2880 RepID=D7FVI7_ECTSI|nr:Hypothetical leucine rich repeat calcium binding protein [Ectocarpus siliculosus]|eukprot:CBJ31908.1 Hypothetical leucine rich repeat calcium binding protein [Ectocarpus siliculosus]